MTLYSLLLSPVFYFPPINQPYAQLMKALEDRGFVKRADRPTILKALHYYCLEKPPKLWAEFREKGCDMCIPKCCKFSVNPDDDEPAAGATGAGAAQAAVVTPLRDHSRDTSSSTSEGMNGGARAALA